MPNYGEIFQRIFSVNLKNNKSFIQTDIYTVQDSVVEEYLASQTDAILLSPSSGNKIIVTGFNIHANAAIGEIYLEFDGGELIGKFYTSQNTRLNEGNFTIEGTEGQDVLIQGGGDAFTISLNYIEVEA